jgi:flavin reductase (DIM6/NTAB) family NADH-FMN oxidoreductase RutF
LNYEEIPLTEAYRLINPGPLVLVATKGNHYDLAPIAWSSPLDYEPVTKLLFVSDPAHQTAINAKARKSFAVCVPHLSQAELVWRCGSVSSPEADKFSRFKIECLPCAKIDARVPSGCVGWIECELIRVIQEGSVELFMGAAVAAFAREGAWAGGRLDVGNPAAQTIHHLGGKDLATLREC